MKNILVGKTRYESGYTGLTHQYLDVERIQDTLYYIINRKGNQFGAMRNPTKIKKITSSFPKVIYFI